MFYRYNLFGILWGIFILIVSILPNRELPEIPNWEILTFDNLVHLIVYWILTILLITGFSKQYTYSKLKYNPVIYAFMIATIYGLIIELMQGILPDRTLSGMDFVANTTGSLLGCAGFYMIFGRSYVH